MPGLVDVLKKELTTILDREIRVEVEETLTVEDKLNIVKGTVEAVAAKLAQTGMLSWSYLFES